MMNGYKRIAVISDIHGNLQALATVIEDIKRRKIDKIICLGDIIAKGSHPSECLKIVRKECEVVLRGNCDRHFTEEFELDSLNEVERNRIIWNKGMLSEEERDYLQNLPFCHECYMSGSFIRFFHATPKADNVIIDVVNNYDTKYQMFEGSEKTITQKVADVAIYGHLHHCFSERFYNRTLINAGSVGNSHEIIRHPSMDGKEMETTQAVYLILEGEEGAKEYGSPFSWQFVRVPYDIKKELETSKDNLEYEKFEYELQHGKYRNMEKVMKSLSMAKCERIENLVLK